MAESMFWVVVALVRLSAYWYSRCLKVNYVCVEQSLNESGAYNYYFQNPW